MPKHWKNMDWNDLESLLDNHHTIGSHTATHAKLSAILSNEKLKYEIIDSADIIESKLGSKIDHFAFTFGNSESMSHEAIKLAKKRFKYIPFKVSKDSHQKGLVLKILKGRPGNSQTEKIFYLRFWFGGKADMHWIGKYSQTFGTRECDDYLSKLVKTHTDTRTGYWIKDPNETTKNEKRLVDKPDTTLTAGKSLNDAVSYTHLRAHET